MLWTFMRGSKKVGVGLGSGDSLRVLVWLKWRIEKVGKEDVSFEFFLCIVWSIDKVTTGGEWRDILVASVRFWGFGIKVKVLQAVRGFVDKAMYFVY